jgi:hypothetical protein
MVATPMRHQIELDGSGLARNALLRYSWRRAGQWDGLAVQISGEPAAVLCGSAEEFVTEHYWGYAAQRNGDCISYRVEHPSWSVWQVSKAFLHCQVEVLYGPEFRESLSRGPSSAFLAEGSPVTIYQGERLL